MERYDKSPEISEESSLLELAEAMGFVETQGMRELRSEIVELMSRNKEIIDKCREYEDVAESRGLLAETEGQIALMIMKALMLNSSGNISAFKDEIRDAIRYASGASNSYPERFKSIMNALKRMMA